MLRNIKLYLTALILLASTSSCLDKYPESAIPENEAMSTFSDAEQVVTGIYAELKNSSLYSGALTLLPDLQSDLVHAVQGNTNTYGNFWHWDIRSTDRNIQGAYAQLYTVIGNCNFFLDQVETVRKNLTQDSEFNALDTYLGEVHGIRALAYSELLKNFCKAYPATDQEAKGMLGVVLAKSYFNRPEAKRASLYDSYQFVIEDLTKAEELLDEEKDEISNIYFSAGAVQALRARTALYMQKWGDAVTYSSKLIDRKKQVYTLSNSNEVSTLDSRFDAYAAMWAYDKATEIIWRIGFTTTSYGGRLGTIFFNFTNDYKNFYPDYIPSQTATKLYLASDLRYGANFAYLQTGYSSGLAAELLVKYYGNQTFMPSRLYHLSMPKPFRLSEQYLIRAEAYCHLKQYPNASKDLTTLRRYRFKNGGGTISVDEKGWLDEISNERVRELYMEGFRLNDLKRWGRGFERKNQDGAQVESATLKIEANNPLFVWPIPQHELEAPGSMVEPNESNK